MSDRAQPLKIAAFEIEEPQVRSSSHQSWGSGWVSLGRISRSIDSVSLKETVNVRGIIVFVMAVLGISFLVMVYRFYDRRMLEINGQQDWFKEDLGFDIAALSIAEKFGRQLKRYKNGDYVSHSRGLFWRNYEMVDGQVLKMHQGDVPLQTEILRLMPASEVLDFSTQSETYQSRDEGIFSGVVADGLRNMTELSEYGRIRERPTLTQAIDIAADLVIALHTLHTKIQGYSILHCDIIPKNVFIEESRHGHWKAKLVGYSNVLVLKLKEGDRITQPLWQKFSMYKHCRGTDWEDFFLGTVPFSANVEWRQLGFLIYRLVEAGERRHLYDTFSKHAFAYTSAGCNFQCSLKMALQDATRLAGPLKEFVEFLIFQHDTIADESEVLAHPVFDNLDRGPVQRARNIKMLQPSDDFHKRFSGKMPNTYRPVGQNTNAQYPAVPPGYPYSRPEKSSMNIEIFIDMTSPKCKTLFDIVAQHVAPNYKQHVNFFLQAAPSAHRPQSGYVHEVATAVYDMAGPKRFWDFANEVFMRQHLFTDKVTYTQTRDAIHDQLFQIANDVSIDNLVELRRRVAGNRLFRHEHGGSEHSVNWRVRQEVKFAKQYVIQRGYCLWMPVVAINGIWAVQIGSGWAKEDWHAFLDYNIALIEHPETAGIETQGRDSSTVAGRRSLNKREPSRPLGVDFPGRRGRVRLELFLDLSNEECKKIFKVFYQGLAAKYEGKVTVTFQHAFEAWKHANVYMHEAAIAILYLRGRKEFWDFADILFDNQHKFIDDSIANKTRHQIYQSLALLSSAIHEDWLDVVKYLQIGNVHSNADLSTEGDGNFGNKVTQDINFAEQFACFRGVAEAPKVFLNGLHVREASGDWTTDDWQKLLDNAVSSAQEPGQKTKNSKNTKSTKSFQVTKGIAEAEIADEGIGDDATDAADDKDL